MRSIALLLAGLLAGCATADFSPRGETLAAYAARHAYFAEFCALSQIKKKRGFGADIRGEIGGHSVFYLNGACRDPATAYPVLHLCDGTAEDGVGLSMNAHFSNAKWVATPGRDFFFNGNLAPDAPVTRATYRAVQAEAKRLGIYDGIVFHDEVFDDMPAGWRRADWKYEMSVATDYAISLGRGRYCARVPVDQAAMARMIHFLNAENAPYRAGKAVFRWSVFQDNCIHLAHNALSVAGLWPEWRINRFLLWAILDFPVPKNEFVNLMRRTNDLPGDPGAVYEDGFARRALLEQGTLPARPGALAEARPPQQPNAVYDTELKLIFYDDPMFGSYQGWFDAIFSDVSYTDPVANRARFAALARRNIAARKPLSWWLERGPYRRDPAGFARVYERYYALMASLANRR